MADGDSVVSTEQDTFAVAFDDSLVIYIEEDTFSIALDDDSVISATEQDTTAVSVNDAFVILTEEDTLTVTLDDDGIAVVVDAVGFDEAAAAQVAQAAAEAAAAAAAASAAGAAASAASAVSNPGGSTDNAIARFDGTTGQIIQDSTATIDNSGNMVVDGTITAKGGSTIQTVGGTGAGVWYDGNVTTWRAFVGMDPATDTTFRIWSMALSGNVLQIDLPTGAVHAPITYGFSAHKNWVDQTGINHVTFTKITFTTEVFDVGGYYDAANSKWTPPAGLAQISLVVFCFDVTSPGLMVLSIYKNGARYKDSTIGQAPGSDGCGVSVADYANGTDYYEAYIYLSTGTTGTVYGGTYTSYFSGKML